MAKMEEFDKLGSKTPEEIEEMGEDPEDAGLNILLDAASICLMRQRADLWDYDKNDGKGAHSEVAEDVLDMPTVYRIIEVCGGIKLDDPNLIAAAMAAAENTPGTR